MFLCCSRFILCKCRGQRVTYWLTWHAIYSWFIYRSRAAAEMTPYMTAPPEMNLDVKYSCNLNYKYHDEITFLFNMAAALTGRERFHDILHGLSTVSTLNNVCSPVPPPEGRRQTPPWRRRWRPRSRQPPPADRPLPEPPDRSPADRAEQFERFVKKMKLVFKEDFISMISSRHKHFFLSFTSFTVRANMTNWLSHACICVIRLLKRISRTCSDSQTEKSVSFFWKYDLS